MIPIHNPFNKLNSYHCFGCASRNDKGLNMTFLLDEINQEVICNWNPKDYLQGYFNILHGGIQATLIDEISCWAVYILLKTAGVTSRIDIRYRKAILVNEGPLTIRARVVNFEKKLATIQTTIYNSKGDKCAEGDAQFFTYTEEMARTKLHYPGYEAFFSAEN